MVSTREVVYINLVMVGIMVVLRISIRLPRVVIWEILIYLFMKNICIAKGKESNFYL